jgi:flagellar motor component MotA
MFDKLPEAIAKTDVVTLVTLAIIIIVGGVGMASFLVSLHDADINKVGEAIVEVAYTHESDKIDGKIERLDEQITQMEVDSYWLEKEVKRDPDNDSAGTNLTRIKSQINSKRELKSQLQAVKLKREALDD